MTLSITEECLDSSFLSFWILDFAFPQDELDPLQLLKLFGNLLVTSDIRIEFMLPKLNSRFRCIGITAPCVPLPETAMHKNDYPVTGENDVGSSRQHCIVKSESVAHTVQQ
jgi:hypothetical protein